jgi:hypothetical protein
MSRFEDTLRRDLRQIADRAAPSPDAWDSILTRIADQEPIQETEVIMLTENTIRTRRWPLVAAAAAIVALIVGVIAVVNRDGATVPADELPAPTVAPEPDTGAVRELPDVGSALEPGRYTTDTPGVAVTFTLEEGQTAPWTLAADERGGIQLWSDETAREFIAIGRIGSWFDADEARDESTTGLGSIPPDDIDGWIEANGIIVADSADTMVGDRPAKYRRIRLDTTPGATADFCPTGEQPCLWAISGSADIIDASSPPVPVGRDRLHSIWLVDMGDFEPLFVVAIPNLDDELTWFENTVQPIVDSIELGEPAPAVAGGTARLSTFASSAEAVELPAPGDALPAGRYTTDQFGTPVTFTVPADASAFQVDLSNPVALGIKNPNGWVGFERIGSFYDATQARDPGVTGLGNIPPDDIDAWIEANGVVVEASSDVTVGGRTAKFRQVRLPDGVARLNLNTISADQLDLNPGSGSELSGIYANAYWFVELDDYEPLGIWAYAYGPDLQSWLDELAPIIDSITLGEPGPAVPGGTARLPERLTVNATMTVNQIGERDIANPWPVERTGELTGDITGTYTGTGLSSPNGAEVTLDWTMDVAIEGLGSGTLTVRSYWVNSLDGATTATDHVIGGTGDLDGVTGFGTTKQTSDYGFGREYTADIELHLAPPTT